METKNTQEQKKEEKISLLMVKLLQELQNWKPKRR